MLYRSKLGLCGKHYSLCEFNSLASNKQTEVIMIALPRAIPSSCASILTRITRLGSNRILIIFCSSPCISEGVRLLFDCFVRAIAQFVQVVTST